MGGWTDGRTDGGVNNIPIVFFFLKHGDNQCLTRIYLSPRPYLDCILNAHRILTLYKEMIIAQLLHT